MHFPRKRSAQIRLVLLGGLASGALTVHADAPVRELPAGQRVYPNDYFVEGAGYYHAPFGNWYQHAYNAAKSPQPGAPAQYFYGGQWGPSPHESIINLSSPNADGLNALNRVNSHVRRGGFGHSYGGRSYFS